MIQYPRRIAGMIKRGIHSLVLGLPYFRFVRETSATQTPITLEQWFRQQVMGVNKGPYWPVHRTSLISGSWRNVLVGVDVAPGVMPGCYIQAIGTLEIGDYTQVGPSVGIITANHDPYDSRMHNTSFVKIGAYCWLGMGAKIMPGVELGDFTVVAAGSVVSKSFPDGHCVIGGVPAKVIKALDRERCVRYQNEFEYHGFIPKARFKAYRAKNLNV